MNNDTTQYYPSLVEFKELAKKGNIIPVYRQLLADTITPVSAYLRISNNDYAFLLESTAGGEKIASRSYLGYDPFMGIRSYGNKTEIITDKAEVFNTKVFDSNDPLKLLQEKMKEFKWVPVDGLTHFAGGAVGYISYDATRYFENLPNQAHDDLHLPDLYLMLYDSFFVFDHVNKTVKVVSAARIKDDDYEDAYNKAICRINDMVEKLQKPVNVLNSDITSTGDLNIKFTSNYKKSDFINAVERCKEYIRSGDILQVVLSQRLKAETDADPFNIYRALRVINPSPYMFYLKFKDLIMIGSSPEVMVKVEGNKVTVRPIAGTRKRGKTDAEDIQLAKELLADPKERAEHIMLLDLGRNDIGRIAQYASVKIDEKMIIEKYSHVMHITSSVSGLLKEGKTAFDAIRACMPAGTLSGAPKIRAMEIIDELEPTKRGPYGGGIGYIDFEGNMNTCITIRTIILKGKDAYVQAGAGIVADSIPENEYEETLNKAKGPLKAIEVAEKMGK
ncbi:MAG: anthranilate synthase component I [Candidatus Anammoxibacter sp.]